jgi:hypothetical protein
VLKEALGDLSKVQRIVKVTGFVNSDSSYTNHPKVINSFSDLMIAVFGDKDRHARTALGVAALPLNMAVEVEVVVERWKSKEGLFSIGKNAVASLKYPGRKEPVAKCFCSVISFCFLYPYLQNRGGNTGFDRTFL